VDGAWMNLVHRKLASPPEMVWEVFSKMPRDLTPGPSPQ
jgi:hypothetical protein